MKQLTIETQSVRWENSKIQFESSSNGLRTRTTTKLRKDLSKNLPSRKKHLKEVAKMLADMQQAPKNFGTVLRVNPAIAPEDVKPEHFIPGANVRVKARLRTSRAHCSRTNRRTQGEHDGHRRRPAQANGEGSCERASALTQHNQINVGSNHQYH